MKLNPINWLLRDEGDLIALFGDARLVKRLNGKFELLGGTHADRADAKESCSLFLHEAIVFPVTEQVLAHRPQRSVTLH